MPWRRRKSGYTTSRGGQVKRPKVYEGLKRRGYSKRRAAAIANQPKRRKR